MAGFSFPQIILKGVIASVIFTPFWAQAAQTPFGFEVGKSIESQLSPCQKDAVSMCFEKLESDGIEVFKIKGEKNILGGRQQQVFVLQKDNSIEQVQVLFKSADLLFVNELLSGLFGEPSMVTSSKEWDGGSEQVSHSKHWVAEDGVISLQDQTAVEGASVAFIRTHADFERTLKAVDSKGGANQLLL